MYSIIIIYFSYTCIIYLYYTAFIFRVETSHDVWQFAVVLFVCLTGCLPWQKASSEDPRFVSYVYWMSSNGIMSPFRRPKLFKLLTSNAQRMFRKFLQPNVQTRPNVLDEVQNFIDERWLSKYMLDKSKGTPLSYLSYTLTLIVKLINVHSKTEIKNVVLVFILIVVLPYSQFQMISTS